MNNLNNLLNDYGCMAVDRDACFMIVGGARSLLKDIAFAMGYALHFAVDSCATAFKAMLEAGVDISLLYMYH